MATQQTSLNKFLWERQARLTPLFEKGDVDAILHFYHADLEFSDYGELNGMACRSSIARLLAWGLASVVWSGVNISQSVYPRGDTVLH